MSDTPKNDDLNDPTNITATIEMDGNNQRTVEMDSINQKTVEMDSINQKTLEIDAVTVDSINTEDAENEESPLLHELVDLKLKNKDYWDQIVRLNAEMDNHRKRAERDVENAHKYAIKNFSEALLPVCDSMEMGIVASTSGNNNIESIKEGMQMTMRMFTQMLEKNGITAINPIGEKFDPNMHQAMSMQESPDHEPNMVMAVMQKGYLIKDRLIRPAMVMVSK